MPCRAWAGHSLILPEPAKRCIGSSTLFERMANLSRGGARADEEEAGSEPEDGSALNIPRFLGRQNNQ